MVNGSNIGAVPDTGSDVMLMSRKYVSRLGLRIETETDNRTCLEFADGSRTLTHGVVRDVEWEFGNSLLSDVRVLCDFHVLDDLPCEVILCNDFLYDFDVFTAYKHFLYDETKTVDMFNTLAQMNLIRNVGFRQKFKRSIQRLFSGVTEEGKSKSDL